MEIRICKSSDLTEIEWESFASNYNTVFKKAFNILHFKNKYLKSCDKNSYHSLLLNDDGLVVGNCSIIPYWYSLEDIQKKLGLAVDVFIREDYRTDPLMLLRMYKRLVKELNSNLITGVLAVPNAIAYPYWKNIVKWNDVGDISYWALPVRIGNVIKKYQFLNIASILYSKFIIHTSLLIEKFNLYQPKHKYCIVESEQFLQERFSDKSYGIYNDNGIKGYYCIIDEDGVETAYLISAREHSIFTMKAMRKCIKHILKTNTVDIIIFVGKIDFFQPLLIKIPHKFDPKRLPLTFDLVDKEYKNGDLRNMKDWDFGLLNYDVR